MGFTSDQKNLRFRKIKIVKNILNGNFRKHQNISRSPFSGHN